MEPARVRISKVRLKGAATVHVLPTRPAPDDTNFVPTLIWVLEQARMGKIGGYAMVFSVENEDGGRFIEAAKEFTDTDRHHVLGLIRRLEANYVARTWAD